MFELASQFRLGTFQIAARAKAIRVLMWIAALCVPIYIMYQLAPFLDRDATIARVLASSEYGEAEKKAKESTQGLGEKKVVLFEYPINELTAVAIEISAVREVNERVAIQLTKQVKIRPDRAILWFGTLAVLLAILTTLLPGLTGLRVGPIHIDLDDDENETTLATSSSGMRQPLSKLSPIDLFAAEVEAAARRADALFSRSTLLLSGGIIMAFIGVGIFYVTLPETKGDETLTSYWPKVVRPTGVLIFVEAIAWFLLRQYRALVEDYKWFYRLYLKRANYLAAIRILGAENVRPEDTFVAVSLIQEDYSGRLKSGETTESLEALKLPEESPVTEALRAFSAIKEKVKSEKSKEQSEKEKSGT